MDGESACGFFDLLLSLFIEADIGGTGKLVGERLEHEEIFGLPSFLLLVLDEAHKVWF